MYGFFWYHWVFSNGRMVVLTPPGSSVSRLCALLDRVLFSPCYLVRIALQPCLHVLRDVIGVETAFVRIAEDRLRTVVVADDDKAIVVGNVKDIETSNLLSHGQLLCCHRSPSVACIHSSIQELGRLCCSASSGVTLPAVNSTDQQIASISSNVFLIILKGLVYQLCCKFK